MADTTAPVAGLTIMTGGDQIALRRALETLEKVIDAYGARVVDVALEDGGFAFRLQISAAT